MPGRREIAALVPQAGAMCLLDNVRAWDAESIHCMAAAPGATHPLARNNALPAIAACEYAAQATAVHGALLEGGQGAQQGMLAKLMEVELHARALPQGEVSVSARMLSRAATGCMYAFEVKAGDLPIASGRLMVAFGSPAP